jgi:hypothetical protein
MNGRYDFIAKVKESWDSLIVLQKIIWEEFKKSEGEPIVPTKYLNLNLRINEDIVGMLDSLRYIGVLYPVENNWWKEKNCHVKHSLKICHLKTPHKSAKATLRLTRYFKPQHLQVIRYPQ